MCATVASILDHYIQRPTTQVSEEMKLLHCAQNYSKPKETGSEPQRHKMKVVIVRPYCSLDPNGPNYEQYCQQKLMLHKPFRQVDELRGECDTFAAAYSTFLQSGNVPQSLEDDIKRLEQKHSQNTEEDKEDNTEVCVAQNFCVQACMHIYTIQAYINLVSYNCCLHDNVYTCSEVFCTANYSLFVFFFIFHFS